ncbi:hypothetical protein ACK31C_16240 [Aeromonas caviae]|uniref:Uncharacterized protein n=1 Tax=Aeromonas caviae TaxID=648 RepID=A0A6M4NPM8_AERCA|nr:hypothetical protein [Aeromonas caviae]QJR99786.1 Hypothetical protein [Aeromonas caviae]QMV81569.1 Hypothetical protein [Aeromonas caviae]
MPKNMDQIAELAQESSSPSFMMPVVSALCAHITYVDPSALQNGAIGTISCERAMATLLRDLKMTCDELGIDFLRMVETAKHGDATAPSPSSLH